jgi:dephospho-CoA kinase
MLWVGLTGSIGTGKSTVALILKSLGYQVVDADFFAHQVLSRGEKAYELVLQNFGPEILQQDQSIDRKKLAQVVFQNADKLQLLESIVHPEVKNRVEMQKQIFKNANEQIVFYDVPLLFEKNMQGDFDKVVVVACATELQQQRLRTRNNWTDAEINSRLKAQLPIEIKIKSADFIIDNNGSLLDLENNVKSIIGLLTQV